MRKIIFLLLALAACTSQPATPIIINTAPAKPTQTPKIIVQTVIITVIFTSEPAEVSSASSTPVPSPDKSRATKQPKTKTPVSSDASTASETENSSPVTLDPTLGGGLFSTMTLTGKILSLRCDATRQITFQVTPSSSKITMVDFYYRIEDRATKAIFDWQGPHRMTPDESGNFILVFTGEDVNSQFRFPNSWLDFQFVGLDDSGGRVGNSEKIVQQVGYTFDCP